MIIALMNRENMEFNSENLKAAVSMFDKVVDALVKAQKNSKYNVKEYTDALKNKFDKLKYKYSIKALENGNQLELLFNAGNAPVKSKFVVTIEDNTICIKDYFESDEELNTTKNSEEMMKTLTERYPDVNLEIDTNILIYSVNKEYNSKAELIERVTETIDLLYESIEGSVWLCELFNELTGAYSEDDEDEDNIEEVFFETDEDEEFDEDDEMFFETDEDDDEDDDEDMDPEELDRLLFG